MVELASKYECTGCGACADTCCRNAITFVDNIEGFAYPVINDSSCVDCGLCSRVCPVLKSKRRNGSYSPRLYAAYAKSDSIRAESTSGGIFSLMAQEFYDIQGNVGGAVYNSDFSVSQIVGKQNRLYELRRSKYAQSNAVGIYKEIKSLLERQEHVLFCGAPCQISALHSYLGKEYNNLISVDFICNGVASPLLLKRYIADLEDKYKAKVTSVQMKDKTYGWHRFSMRIMFADGREYCQDRYHDAFFRGYLQTNMFLRNSCYNCPFKGIPHDADLTIGDFWKIEHLDENMDQDKGTSLVIVNSENGQSLFNQIQDKVIWKEFSVQDLLKVNPAVLKNHSEVETETRRNFYMDARTMPFSELIEKYIAHGACKASSVKRIIKHILPEWLRPKWNISYWRMNNRLFHEYFDYDVLFNAHWAGRDALTRQEMNSMNMRIIRCYRKCQAAQGTIWFPYWYGRLQKISDITGVGLIDNLSIGKGLIIGHVGTIVLNRKADFSKGHIYLTHGVTVGRDIRGKRKGTPRFGRDVVIRCNSTITGNISIGDDVLIAPNTFVNFDVPSHSVVIGNPATIHHRDNATEGHIGKM